MTDPNYRMERITRLLHELRYEVERGLMEREIDETLKFEFIYPNSQSIPGGRVHGVFSLRPKHAYELRIGQEIDEPRLKVVK